MTSLTSGGWLELDLLRRRREELGLIELSTLPVGRLLGQGSVVGGGVVVVVLLLLMAVALQLRIAVQRRDQLSPFSHESNMLQQQEDVTTTEIAATEASNRAIADAVAGLRSSSALLTELQRLAPQAIRFQMLSTKGDSLEIEGEVLEPFAVQTLNAFQLRLDASSFFEPNGFALERADVVLDQDSPKLKFRFSGSFATDSVSSTRARLKDLGTPGLAERINRLEREGLLP